MESETLSPGTSSLQAFDRFMTLSRKYAKLKKRESRMQIRFGHADLEVVVKCRGTFEPYKNMPTEELMGMTTLPPMISTGNGPPDRINHQEGK